MLIYLQRKSPIVATFSFAQEVPYGTRTNEKYRRCRDDQNRDDIVIYQYRAASCGEEGGRMMQAYIKTGDTRTPIAAKIKMPDGKPVPLAGASVTFTMSRTKTNYLGRRVKTDDPPLINAPALIIGMNPSRICYAFEPGETDQSGVMFGEFEVEYPDGSTETFPNVGYITINIAESLA